MTETSQATTLRQLLSLPGVRRLWTAQFVSLVGDFMALFAVVSLASFRWHATASQIAGISLAYMLPLAVFGPVAGVCIDRWNLKCTLLASDLVRALLVALLLRARQFNQIYAILCAISAVSTFSLPAQAVTLRRLVPRHSLLAANAFLQQTILITRLACPAFAALLASRAGANSCFYLDAASFVVSASLVAGLLIPPAPSAPATRRPLLNDLTAAVRLILRHTGLAFALFAITAASFAISCFSPLIAVLARDVLHAGVRAFGFLSTAIGLGTLAGTQTVRHLAPVRCHRNFIVLGLAVMSVGIILIGYARVVALMASGAFVLGAGLGFLMLPAQTLLQTETPLTFAGRVSSAVMSLVSTAQILGLILSGVLAGIIGLRPVFFFSAALLLAAAVVAWSSSPKSFPPATG